MATEPVPQQQYALRLTIDYPDRPLKRLTTFFRILMAIPILILSALVMGGGSGGGVIVLPTLLMILFRQKYPRWWFNFNLELTRFSTRVGTYLTLLRDEYPSTDEDQAVHLDIDYPDVKRDLNQWLPLVKWLLAFPHYIVLFFLLIAALVSVVLAWFAILFTGKYPRGLFDFVVGVQRWVLRVQAYASLLVTDRYPPFSLQ